ncbi:DNA damage-inducible transcript 4-like protein [Ptychodera flava]|uniref:DNA damage-inducible transcript 4-like protein n=1 Tax=Ptychodera flava TaxID=63121 RepID=UPI00396A01D4
MTAQSKMAIVGSDIRDMESVGVAFSLQRMFEKLAEILLGPKKSISPGSVIETAKLEDSDLNNHLLAKENKNCYGGFEDNEEKETCESLSKRVFDALLNAKRKMDCPVQIPCDLTMRIAQDVMRMSHSEPCGIRGCVIFITLEDGSQVRKLGKVIMDPSTVATFEIHLVLSRVNMTFFNLTLPSCVLFGGHDTIRVSPGFKLIKNKLYRSHMHTGEE